MNKYLEKQIKIALVYFLIFMIVGLLVYLFIQSNLPSCYDNIQNQGEAGIDCGGPCPLCSWQLQKDLEVISIEAIKTQDDHVDLVAKVKNSNRNFGARSFSYMFNLYDSGNNLILGKQGNSYILPQETRYVIEQKVLVDVEISRLEFKVVDIIWQKLIDYEEPELLIRNPDFRQIGDISRAVGTLENRSNYDFDKIDIQAVLFDESSKIIGAGQIDVRTILSKESRYFEISWFSPIAGRVEKMDIIAKANVFLDENFMKRYGDREKFQEY